jgi:vacuolar protein sorting-associated protein 13A/C
VVKILDIFLTPYELQILGINMSVGIDGCLGKPMIREGQGLDIFVRRSLRDVFRKVPTFSLEVKVTSNPNA